MEAIEDTRLTPAEAAVRASRSEDTILRWVREKRLPARRDPISRRISIRAADLESLLRGEPVSAIAPTA